MFAVNLNIQNDKQATQTETHRAALSTWRKTPRANAKLFYVRTLALKYSRTCPLWGSVNTRNAGRKH